MRTAAEFAKVAMGDQSLDDDEVLNVRWALVDPNPIAQAVEEQAASARFIQAATKRIASVPFFFKLCFLYVCTYHFKLYLDHFYSYLLKKK